MSKATTSLPEKWRVTTIGSVCSKPQYGWTTSAAESGDVKLLRTTDITRGPVDWSTVPFCRDAPPDIDKYLLAEGDIVVSRAGSVGVSCRVVAPERSVFASYLIRFRPKEEVDGLYLSYVLQSPAYWTQVRGSTAGIAIPNVNASKLEAFDFPLAPLPEQRRIVAEIEKQFTRLDAGVAALRRVQANLKRYRAAVLKAAFEGRLVRTEAELAKAKNAKTKFQTGAALLARILADRRRNWSGRGNYKEPAAPTAAKPGFLSDGWAWTSVEQLLTEPLCNGISIKGSDNPPGVRALRLSAMSDSGFDYSESRYLPLKDSDVDDLWIREGDFFMSRGNGSLHLVGRGTSAQKPPYLIIFPDTMIRLRLTDAVRKSGWLRTLWPSRIIRSQIEARVKTTAGIYKIAQPQVEEMVIPLPPLAEQTRIVAEVERRLSVVEELEVVISANLQRATRLRQSILQQAFLGDLN